MAAVVFAPRIVATVENSRTFDARSVHKLFKKKATQDNERATPAATAVSSVSFAFSLCARILTEFFSTSAAAAKPPSPLIYDMGDLKQLRADRDAFARPPFGQC